MTGPTEPPYPGPQDPHYPNPQPYPGPPYPGQPYGQPYPGQPYPGQPYPGQPSAGQPGPGRPTGAGPAIAVRLGARLADRPAPRLGIALAGVGVALAVVGVVVWGLSYVTEGQLGQLASGRSGSSSRHFLGAILALVVAAIGYALVIGMRRGPLATAGVAASALGVPVAMEFLTYDPTGAEMFNIDAIVWVSVLVYLVSYLFVPGSRGHTFYLGLALLFLWEYAVDKAAPSETQIVGRVVGGISGTSDNVTAGLDFGTLAGVSLTFGVIYYALAWALDRAGRRGAGVAFALVGFFALAVGIGALAPDAKQVGTGIVLVVVGIAVALYGARYDRRFTTWIWAVGAALGAVLILIKIVTHGGTAIGIGLIVLGAVFVVGGWLLAKAISEPDDVVEPAAAAGPTLGGPAAAR